MQRPMHVIIKPLRRINLDILRLALQRAKLTAHEAIIPGPALRHQEIALDAVTQQQLALIGESRCQEALRLVRGLVAVGSAPCVALRCESPSGKGDATGREGDSHGDGLAVPGGLLLHELRMLRDVRSGHELRLVARDGVDDAEGLEVV